jgi:hypothetical protein
MKILALPFKIIATICIVFAALIEGRGHDSFAEYLRDGFMPK